MLFLFSMNDYVSNTVSEFRRQRNVTQEEFARAIGVSRQTVIAIEKGNYIPSLLLGMKIANFFNKKVEEVFIYHEK